MMDILNKLNLFLKSNVGKQLQNYSLFYAFVWVFHLILISVISYFHLILNHNIGTIADWIVDRGWMVIVITKVIIFYLAIQFMKLRTKKYALIRGMLRNAISWPRHESAVIILFLIIGTIALGDISINSSFIIDILRTLTSTVGVIVFFGIDIFLILILDVFDPIRNDYQMRQKLFIFPLLFYLFSRMTFIYEQVISFKLYSYMFLLIYLAYWRRRNWTLPTLLIATFIVPTLVFMGLDPVWGASFSISRPIREISTLVQIILIGFAVGYLEWRKINYPEFIYRD